MGFDKWEAEASIVANPQPELDLGTTRQMTTQPKTPEVMVSIPFVVTPQLIPTNLQPAIQTRENSQGTSLIINKGTTDEEFDQIEQAVIE
ncbi:hypothetical protein VXE43_21050, partial [Acinetobacter baumannii]